MGDEQKKREYRAFELDRLEVRQADGDDVSEIVGYAAVFEKLSEEMWGFREKIAKGAFANSIKDDDVRALWNHDSNYVLGRNKSGTLELEEDEHGLRITIKPPDTQWARDLVVSIDRGDVSQMSFGFETLTDEWDQSDKKNVVRTLKEVRLWDVSPVTFPAYTQTTVAVRTAEEVYDEFLAAESQEDEAAAQERASQKEARDTALREIDLIIRECS